MSCNFNDFYEIITLTAQPQLHLQMAKHSILAKCIAKMLAWISKVHV